MNVARSCSTAHCQPSFNKRDMNSDYEENRAAPNENAKTSDFYNTTNLPKRFDNPGWFKGYEGKVENPNFKTTNSQYGSKPPSVHTMPTSFNSRSQKFTNHLGPCGMYRNHSMNTFVEQKPVPDHFPGHLYY